MRKIFLKCGKSPNFRHSAPETLPPAAGIGDCIPGAQQGCNYRLWSIYNR